MKNQITDAHRNRLEKHGRVAVDCWLIKRTETGATVANVGAPSKATVYASLEEALSFVESKYPVL